ncbi:hypothetical protein MTO96_000854 [Rhipicephalus appendiculatus]
MAFNRVASPLFLVFLAAIGSGAGAEDESPSVLRSMLHAFVRRASDCDPLTTTLSDDIKKALVTKHNDYRSKVASGGLDTFAKASNMKKLKWEDALEKTAQATADKCEDTREKTASALDTDNLDATSPAVDKFVDSIVDKWYAGHASFKPADLDSYPAATDDAGENFAQLVWADTESVGCGFKHYKPKKDPTKPVAILACNYYPGLKAAAQVYKKGDPCVDCGTGYKCDSTKLCPPGGGGDTAGGDSTGESKGGGGPSALAVIGIIGALVAVTGVIVGLVVMRKHRAAHAAAAAHATGAAPDATHPSAAHASAGEQGAAAGSHEAAAGDAAEAEKTAEAHEAPATAASHEALAHK